MCHPICKSDSLLCHGIGEVLGEAPAGLLLSRHASRVNKLRIYLILLIFWGVRLRHTYIGSALAGRNLSKIKFKNYSKIYSGAPVVLFYLECPAGGNQTTDLSEFSDFLGRTPAAYGMVFLYLRRASFI